MESKPQTQSVIAKLMGLDEMPHQQPVHTRKRVLSENYLRKTAAIGLREKRSIKEGQSFSINTEKKQELKEVLGMPLPGILKKQKAKSSTNEANMAFVRQRFEDAKRLSVSEKLQQAKAFNDVLEDLNSNREVLLGYLLQSDNSLTNSDLGPSIVSNTNGKHRNIEKTTSPRNILRSLQKLETGFATEPHRNHHLPTKIVILKPNLGKERSAFRSSTSHSSQSGDSKREFSSPTELHPKARERGTLKNAFQPSGDDFGVLKGNATERKIITPKTRHMISTSSLNVSTSKVRVADTSVSEHEVTMSLAGSTFLREAKERLSERWKLTKVSQEVGTGSCGPTLGEMLSVPDLEGRPKTLNIRLDKHGPHSQFDPKTGNRELGSPLCTSSNEGNLKENYMSIYSGNYALSPKGSNFASVCSAIDVMTDAETKNVELATGDSTKQQSVLMASDMFVKDGSCFCDGSAGQESQIGSDEYVVEFLNCMSSGEVYQPSPNSVLEPPFKGDDSPGSHSFETVINTDLQGLWIQLQLLKSESEETDSEGTGMVVSSDEDTTEISFHSSSKNVKLMKYLREGESRDFSYLLDVLEESGLHGGTTLVSFDSWNSPECLLSPSIFEALEKKYSEHSSWSKAERKLLFDRVNAGLMGILKPWLDVHNYSKPLSKKVSNALRRDVIEEELWTLLISEEREVAKELSEKALGRESWLEFWDDIETIAIDIENFLFDELAAELVSI